jgi:hypothetical protein
MAGHRVELELQLPEASEQDRLLAGLARLIALRGHEHFLECPIVLPVVDSFSPSSTRDLRGAGRLALDLLSYARLTDLDLRLQGYRKRPTQLAEGVRLKQADGQNHAAAWFAGIKEGVCVFGLELSGLRSDHTLTAALAHEVTHAYRHEHGLVVQDRDAEEQLTDLTAVYLGFGIFLLNASHLMSTGGYSEGGDRLLYERQSLGYLSPAQFALLLSAQVVARGATPNDVKAIRKHLSPNQAQLFGLGVAQLGADVSSLRARLGIPIDLETPKPWLVTLPSDDEADSAIEIVESEAEPVHPNVAGPVAFRVLQTQTLPICLAGLFASFMLGIVLDFRGNAWFILLGVGGGLFAFAGSLRRADWCSGCRARLTADNSRCPKCGLWIVSTIDRYDDRLAAEESYEAERAKRRRATSAASDADAREEDPMTRAWVLMFTAWAIRKKLGTLRGSDHAQLTVEQILRGELPLDALHQAREARQLFLTEQGHAFRRYYFEASRVLSRDFAILTTAAEFRADLGSFRRASAIFERRFEEWTAAKGGTPIHAGT